MPRTRRPTLPLVLSAAALAVAVGGSALAAVAAIPADGRFTACYQTSSSVLNRIVLLAEPGEQCPASYSRVTWPAQAGGGTPGPAGPEGPAGPSGRAGPAGPAGPRGASGAADLTKLTHTVVERQVELDEKGQAVARCPKGLLAVGGGGATTSPSLALSSSVPLVENRTAVGWAIKVYRERQFRIFENVPKQTRDGGVPEHSHAYFLGPFLMAVEKRALTSGSTKVSVHAVCVRLLTIQVAKPRQPGKVTTRKGA